MKIITKIGVLSLAKIMMITFAVMGFILGLYALIIEVLYSLNPSFYAAVMTASGNTGTIQPLTLGQAFLIGFGNMIIIIILMGLLGLLMGLIGGWTYNLYTKKFSGIKFDFKEHENGKKN